MTNYLFYDTETSGFISGKKTFDDPTQAFAVQLAALLCDSEGNELNSVNRIIKAKGRFIDPRTTEIHGITEEIADEKGIEENEVLEEYAVLLESEPMRICHNVKFDEKFLLQLFQRNLPKLSDYGRSRYYLESTLFCTMSDPGIKTYVDARNVKGHKKAPRLDELYQKLFDRDFEHAHDAMADTRALKECFFELIKRGIIEV